MELRSVEELMDLLYACRGVRETGHGPGAGVDLHDHALRTAALLRRSRPADKELQLTGLVHPVGQLLRPADPAGRAGLAADAVGPLLGPRVARLLRRHPWRAFSVVDDDDLLSLRQADEDGLTTVFDAGVLEDWRTVLELVAARNSRLGAVD
ncbi:inositol oxygenase [Streptomyces sp. IBSBF 2953]|uniref:inositol oxygenase n=1 Tax=Streptomyces TaxID=1883 RepID=UPI00211A16E3|nr:inositol oxygenase [Streptomyces scabiei]MCQ9183021.1 inositol oxygenase [Streptomyces hayashii]MDX3115516.1 inositol oxygenase [Streptomyces scabiei]